MMQTNEVIVPIEFDSRVITLAVEKFKRHLFKVSNEYICSNCGLSIGGDYYHCPSCKTEFHKTHVIRNNANYSSMNEEIWVNILQKTDDRIVFRGYIVSKHVNKKTHTDIIDCYEVQRDTIYKGKIYVNSAYPESPNYWHDCAFADYFFGGGQKIQRRHINIVPESYYDFLQNTDLKYTKVWEYMQNEPIHNTFRMMKNAALYPWVELIHKQGMTNLCRAILEGYADMRVITPKTIKSLDKSIKKLNPSYYELYAYLRFKKIGTEIDLSKLNGYIDHKYIKSLIDIHKITNMNPIKVHEYLKIQKDFIYKNNSEIKADDLIQTYQDYLNMMVKTNRTPDNDLLAFPRDLAKAHNDAVIVFNTLENEAKNEEYSKFYDHLKKLNYSNGLLSIIVPKDVSEIIAEGKILHHCVGSYVDNVVKGTTTILFIRRANDEDHPYYTVEYQGGKVIQCRGVRNSNKTDEIDQFLIEWQKHLIKKSRKVEKLKVNIQVMAAA